MTIPGYCVQFWKETFSSGRSLGVTQVSERASVSTPVSEIIAGIPDGSCLLEVDQHPDAGLQHRIVGWGSKAIRHQSPLTN